MNEFTDTCPALTDDRARPAYRPHDPEAAAPTSVRPDDPINILIVDDEPGNLTVLESVLDDPGYRLVRAASAEQAWLALGEEEFALLILDINLSGTAGIELARTIKSRKETAAVPIIFLTAHYHEDQHLLAGCGLGAMGYLHKPVNAAILRSKVAAFAELHRKNRECAMANRALLAEVTACRQAEERLRAWSHHVVQAQEIERGRVAVELHDHISQLLCAVLFRSQALADKLSTRDGPLKSEAMKLSEMLGTTADEVERISRTLRPSVLDQLGIDAVLHTTGTQFAERTGMAVTLACVKLTERLPADTELALYRILEQALKNVEAHARAHHVAVELTLTGAFLQLTIKDDGRGFDPDRFAPARNGRNGVGLLGMRERAACVGGILRVTSAPRAGTQIEVRIPVTPRAAVESKSWR